MLRALLAFCLWPLTWTPLAAQAQTRSGEIIQDNQWHGAISIGGSATSGNNPGFNLSQNLDGVKATPNHKISLYALHHAGKSRVNGEDTTTANLLRLGGRYDHRINADAFAFGGGELSSNRLAGERFRRGLNTGLGYSLYRSPQLSLDLMAGIGVIRVDFTDGTSRQGPQWLLAQELSYKLSESTTLKEKLSVELGNADLGQRMVLDTRVSTAILGAWTLDVGFNATRVGVVAPGMKRTDAMFTLGIGYKY